VISSVELPIAVFDSSVLVPRWSRIVLQQLAAPPRPRFVPVWSEWIIAETWQVLTWQWVDRASRTDLAEWRRLARAANDMLRYLLRVMTLVSTRDVAEPSPKPAHPPRPSVPARAPAFAAKARYVVSHNLQDFPPLIQGRHVYCGIEYLTAIEFIEGVLGEDGGGIYGAPLPAGALVRSQRQV